MADIAVTAGRVRIQESIEARLIPMIAGAEIGQGQAVYRMADGRAGVAQANATGTAKVVGIATKAAKAGVAFEALYHGRLQGFELGTATPGTTVYLSARRSPPPLPRASTAAACSRTPAGPGATPSATTARTPPPRTAPTAPRIAPPAVAPACRRARATPHAPPAAPTPPAPTPFLPQISPCSLRYAASAPLAGRSSPLVRRSRCATRYRVASSPWSWVFTGASPARRFAARFHT